jgi:hypothetical protein
VEISEPTTGTSPPVTVVVDEPELEVPQPAAPRPAAPTALPHTLIGAEAMTFVVPVEMSDP